MAASKSKVERVLEVILKHVPKETALKILEELMTVPGNKSFAIPSSGCTTVPVNDDRDDPLGGHPWRPSRPRRGARGTRDARDASEIRGFRAAVLKVRIHLPPAESPSLSRSCRRGSRTPAFRAAVRGWLGDRVGRDAPRVARQPAAISLSGHIPVPQCR